MIAVFDNVVADPLAYRAFALSARYRSIPLGPVTFHGIAHCGHPALPEWFNAQFRQWKSGLTFFRRSPADQVEPNDIHNDVDMGVATALLYLNPAPAAGDGTVFWRHLATGADTCTAPVSGAIGHDRGAWQELERVEARFNRCVVFDAARYHSRAIVENYGAGDDARLIQVLFADRRLA